MNIVISGQCFAITAALSYFIDASKRLGHNVITTGAFHGVNMPYANVTVVSEKYALKPDIPFPPMPIGDSSVPVEAVEARLPDGFIPDLWLQVNAGFYLDNRPKNGKNVMFLTDPHTGLRDIYNRIRPNFDYYFNPQTKYSVGDEYYLPYAADSVYHRPMVGVEKIYDVCIIGNSYQQRIQLIQRLRSLGINCFFELGLAKEDAQLVMNQSKICINWSSMEDLTARVFEAMGTGNCLVANRVPDLVRMFEDGEDFVGFSSEDEAVNKIQYLLKNEGELYDIANRGRHKIENNGHFWENRVNTILEVINGN